EELPRTRHALELVLSPRLQADPRAGHQITNRARHQNLPSTGPGADARRDVHGHAGDVVVDDLTLACVNPGADLNVELGHGGGANSLGAADRPGGAVEGAQRAVSDQLHDPSIDG